MINFRYAPKDLTKEEQDILNEKISHRILESGYAAIFTTVLNGKTVLRICAIHPEATQEDMQHTIDLLDQYGRENLYGDERLRKKNHENSGKFPSLSWFSFISSQSIPHTIQGMYKLSTLFSSYPSFLRYNPQKIALISSRLKNLAAISLWNLSRTS